MWYIVSGEEGLVANFWSTVYNGCSVAKIALMIIKKAKKTEMSRCGHLCVGH